MHSWSIVTEGLTWPNFPNHLSTCPVHTPLMSSASLTRASRQFPQQHSLCKVTVHWQRHGQYWVSHDLTTPWWAKCIWSKMVLSPHLWGQVLHYTTPPACQSLGQGWEEKAEHIPEACCAVQEGHCQGESLHTGKSSAQLDTIQKSWFPIRGNMKIYSVHHVGKIGRLGKKMGLIL